MIFNKNLKAVDAMSLHVWAEPIKNKSAATIRRVLTSIFDSIQHPIKEVSTFSNVIQEVATDQGILLKNAYLYYLMPHWIG